MKWNRNEIPTILGIFLLFSLFSTLVVLQEAGILRLRAGKNIRPEQIRKTNITPDSFVVSWITAEPAAGMVKVELNGQERVFIDSRDTIGQPEKYTTHYVEVKGLEPNKDYQYIIISGGNEFSDNNQSFEVKTAVLASQQIPQANLASGKVETGQGEPAQGAIVYVEIEGISPLSSLVTSQGNWAVSLAKAYSKDLQNLADYQEGEIIEEIVVEGAEKGASKGRTFTKYDDPVSTITLGEDFDFTDPAEPILDEDIGAEPTLPPSGSGGFRSDAVDFEQSGEFKIINPQAGETINVPQPEIFGTGPAGGKVKIVLESATKYEAELIIDDDQEWEWSPPQALEPGSHTLTISYTDPETGKEEEFKRTFVLAAEADTGPAFSATPSGDTVTPTSTPAPTATPEPTATATPTESPSVSQPSTESGVPETGIWQITGSLLIGGVIIFLFLGWGKI